MIDKTKQGQLFPLDEGFSCKDLPSSPGVYIFFSSEDSALYVGKAKSLRQRLLSYFRPVQSLSPRIRLMVQKARLLEIILTRTEKEALILEAELISSQKPKYNVRLRDDKAYPFLRLGIKSDFPRLSIVRRRKRDGAAYFGPYTSSQALRQTLRIIFNVFRLRSCSDAAMKARSRPCLKYQIDRCSAPCTGAISKEDYQADVERVKAFLQGQSHHVASQLEHAMKEAAARLEFERAALYRDQLQALQKVLERQAVVLERQANLDVIHIETGGDMAEAAVIRVRQGAIYSTHLLGLEAGAFEDMNDIYANFLKIYYSTTEPPAEIVISHGLTQKAELEQLLGYYAGKRVFIRSRVRDKKRDLLEMARLNAEQGIERRRRQYESWQEKAALLGERLKLERLPNRVEGIDISNTSGRLPVGSLVRFYKGLPDKKGYRHYFLGGEGPDDYVMIRQVMERRLKRALQKRDLPDLFLIDGGRGQLNSAVSVLKELALADQVDIISIAKDRDGAGEKIFLCDENEPLVLKRTDPVLIFCQQIRDEAHRFGLKVHRRRRSKEVLDSELAKIPGVGYRRQMLLLRYFGSVEKIANATMDELEAVPGLPKRLCIQIARYFNKEEVSGKD